MNAVITHAHLDKSISYETYTHLIERLLEEDKTTGPNQSEQMVEYTRLNRQRSHRVGKTVHLMPELVAELQSFKRPVTWLVLTEGWCGDAAQNLPVLNMMAEASPAISLRLLLRDENLDVMDAYLTNGGRSIPKLICLDTETLEVLGTWGPRPARLQQMVVDYKKLPEPKEPYSEFTKKVQLWYAQDKGLSLQHEFMQLLPQWEGNKQTAA